MKHKNLAALYLRLSREDGDGESSSIANQRQMLTAFVNERDDLEIINEYVDDGYSGYVFDRPAFLKMLEDVKAGTINCIIVKDFSRLGRSFQKTEEYMQRIFPKYRVRFIAVNNCYDSSREQSSAQRLSNPLINLMNEYHVAETSQKVRATLEHHRNNGRFIGNHAPFGYRIIDKALVVDEVAAEVVRRIFRMKIEGMSNQAIADLLNHDGVDSPLEYKLEHGASATGAHLKRSSKAVWQSMSIRRVLENPVYIGTLVQGKTYSVSYRDRRRFKRDPAQMAVFEDAHEAIISDTEFLIVQDLLNRDSYSRGGKSYLFSTFAYCGSCGEMLYHRQDGDKESWQCRNRDCSSKGNIKDVFLSDIVFMTLKAHLALVLDHTQTAQTPALIEEVSYYRSMLRKLHKKIRHYKALSDSLQDKLGQGVVDDADFAEMQQYYRDKIEQTTREVQEIGEKQQKLKNCLTEIRLQYQKLCCADHLTREMLVTMVEKIEVYPENKVRLHLRYSNLFGNGGDTNGTEIP